MDAGCREILPNGSILALYQPLSTLQSTSSIWSVNTLPKPSFAPFAGLALGLVVFVTLGAVLGGLGIYKYLIDFAGCGATVPLTGFGYNLAKGAIEGVKESGLVGAFTGGVKAYTSLEEAVGDFNGRKVNVVRNVTESIESFNGCVGKKSRLAGVRL